MLNEELIKCNETSYEPGAIKHELRYVLGRRIISFDELMELEIGTYIAYRNPYSKGIPILTKIKSKDRPHKAILCETESGTLKDVIMEHELELSLVYLVVNREYKGDYFEEVREGTKYILTKDTGTYNTLHFIDYTVLYDNIKENDLLLIKKKLSEKYELVKVMSKHSYTDTDETRQIVNRLVINIKDTLGNEDCIIIYSKNATTVNQILLVKER